jgi:hypothetical protein
MCSRKRQRGVHKHKEPSSYEDTIINVQQAKRQRGVHTYKEPSRHEDTIINVQQARDREGCTHTRSQAVMRTQQ